MAAASTAAASWQGGDFNYDDLVDILDVIEFQAAGLYNAGPYAAAATASVATRSPLEEAFAVLAFSAASPTAPTRRAGTFPRVNWA